MRNLETQKTQMQQIMQKELQKKLRDEADRLENQIVNTFGVKEARSSELSKKRPETVRKSSEQLR